MRTISILCSIVFLLSLAAWPVLDYAGGRACMPLTFPPLGPAQITTSAIGLLAAVVLVIAVIKSLLARRRRVWTIGALTIAIATGWAFQCYHTEWPGFLDGLRDRFVLKVGYPKLREFAKEMAQTGTEALMGRPGLGNAPTAEQQKRWDDLVARYPFLDWTNGPGVVIVRDGIVELTWGSALTGHWGVQVAPAGVVKDAEDERDTVLRVSDDIQYVYHFN